ncbi:MAG: NAD(P)H-dependent oxidoreductase [Pseudomonadota bacterium]
MKTLIVYANPEPTSFSAAMKDVARNTLMAVGHEVVVSDLYAENFNPVAGRHDFSTTVDAGRFHYQQEQLKASQENGFSAELVREQKRVADADLFIFIYPLWWGGMPAILKGWFDRVLAYGFAYADGKRFDSGFFKGRHGIVALTTGGTPERFSDGGVYGPIENLLYPHRRTMLEYLGLEVEPSFVAYASPRVSQAEREKCLADWSAQLAVLAEKMAGAPVADKSLPQAALAGGSNWASNSGGKPSQR